MAISTVAIYGLRVEVRSDVYGSGLFGCASGGSISNVAIESAAVFKTGDHRMDYYAILCGFADDVTISGCSVSGRVESLDRFYIGGLVGGLINSTMTNCTASGVTIKGKNFVGGLCGYMRNSAVSGCSAVNCIVNGNDMGAGGLVGSIQTSSTGGIKNCTVSGTVKGRDYVGGLVGFCVGNGVGNSVYDCSANVDLTSTGISCGGLVGSLWGDDKSEFVGYGFDGTISGASDVGAAVGTDSCLETLFDDCWYNADKTGDLPAVGESGGREYPGIIAKNLGK